MGTTGEAALMKEGTRCAIHVSDFIIEHTGRLCLSPEQLEHQQSIPACEHLVNTDAREIMYPGKNYDGWWNAEQLIAQV
jgi:hypothetical protein